MRRFAILAALLAAVALGQWSLPPYNLVISGGVTAVRAGYLMSFSEDPLVDTGTIAWDSAGFKTWYAATSTGDSITKGVVKATRVRAATIYTTNIFPTATTTHLLFALTASTSLDSVRFKATVVRGDSLAFTAVTATNFRGALTGNASTATTAAANTGTWKTLDTSAVAVLARKNTFAAAMTNSDSAFHNGYVGLGDYMTDYLAVYGQTLTRNTGGTSNWVDIYRPDSLVRGSFWHSASKIRGLGGTGQFNQVFINAEADTDMNTFSLRGGEIKGTAKATMRGTSQLMGAYLKTVTGGTNDTTAFATPCYSILETDATDVTNLGYNFYAENTNAGTFTAGAILGVHPTNNTWPYGFDFYSATFTSGDVRLAKGATIVNGHVDTLTITEANIKLMGTTLLGGKFQSGSVVFDSASHGTRRDTVLFWAHDTAYAIVKRP